MKLRQNSAQFLRILLLVSLAASCLTGCQEPEKTLNLDQLRDQVLTDKLPSAVVPIEKVYEESKEGAEITIAGRIFAADMYPFDRKYAAFSLIELPKPGHNHEDPGDCPFCKREMENAALATIQLVDESGELIEKSAEELLGLSENQDVVVDGQVVAIGEFLVVNANSIHPLSASDTKALSKQVHSKETEE